ncbi:hypothetical protein GF108_12375 [Phyllobacterium sp. SYP-B3895]|uniref:hypothetical protein n=1 Tax=Phyllobacterium sp. SYP-B3895 TaxID=2663240 RepID=UPI001299EA67|nr:hypothetical protein [Phyllobacterium sp. SYP-B3895]MRG56374.1 hypothetical protein [Phyllobacterium sp. SYP-B3895]
MKKMIVISAMLMASPACAMTGAQFVQAPKAIAVGYAQGVVDYVTTVGSGDQEIKRIMDIRSCFASSKISNDTFYSSIMAHIQNNPENLPNSAVGSVLQVIEKMCPDKR